MSSTNESQATDSAAANQGKLDLREAEHVGDVGVQQLHEPIARETVEPRDGFEPLPMWLIFSSFALLMWGGYYLGAYNGNFAADVYDMSPQMRGGGPVATAAAPVDLRVVGERFYNSCAACHGRNGEGVAGKVPPLEGSRWVTGRPEILARILLQGLQGPIEVRGETYNDQMPAWGHRSDREIAGVLTYIRTSWGNDAAPVSEELIAAVRAETEDRQDKWTAEQLKEVEADLPSEGTVDPDAADDSGDRDEEGGAAAAEEASPSPESS